MQSPAGFQVHHFCPGRRAPVLREGSSLQPPAHLVGGGAAGRDRSRRGRGSHRATETQLPSTRSRTWQHSRNREFSPSELLQSRFGDELGRCVAQGCPSRNSVGSSQSTQSLAWHGAELLTREETHTCQGDLSGSRQSQQVNIIPLGWRHLPQLRQPGLCCHAWSFGHTKKASSVSSTAPLTAPTAAAAAWQSSSS